jgi:hypothetical protein
MLRSETRGVHHLKCLLCSFVKGKNVILRPKVDTFEKNVGKTKFVRNMPHLGKKYGEWYVKKNYKHVKNEVDYYKKNHLTIVEEVQGGVKGEWGRKRQ